SQTFPSSPPTQLIVLTCRFHLTIKASQIRLCALNDDSSEESDHEPTQESVKQAKQKGDYTASEEAYNHLLNSALVKEALPPDEDTGLVEPGHVLKYSAYKNLASLAEKREQWEKSIDAYLQAVALDDSDVTVWHHLGMVALKTFDLCLARHSFEEGLKCNPKHWPCLDLLCTVLYAIGDYYSIALKNQIFSEEPPLKKESQHLRNLFNMCYAMNEEEQENEENKFVKEALHLREQRLKLVEADRAPPPPYAPVKPLTSHTWASLGECFIALYDHLTSPENPQPLGRRVDLEEYYKAIVTPDISMSYRTSVVKVPDYSSSSFSTEGFSVYKNVQTGESEEKSKKGPKRKKPPPSAIDDFLPKRRSARVRTNKKKEEEINYRELVQSFIPSLFRPSVSVDDESSQDSLTDGSQFSQRSSQSQATEGKPGEADRNNYDEVITGEAEALDILTFVKEHMENGGIIDVMNQYGICLAAQNNKKWPSALADVFLKTYQRMRKHVILPSEFCDDQDSLYRTRMAKLVLVVSELTLDKLLTAKSKSSSSLSPASSPRGCDQSIHGDFTLEMAIRVNWMRARYLMLQGQMDYAMMYLDRTSKFLELKVNSIEGPTTVKLVNCKVDNLVTIDQVQKKLESLQRCQSLEEVHRLYESGYYEDVVQLLMPTLHQPQPKTKVGELGMSIPERPAQLLLLQDSLIKLKDYERCLTCSEIALNEAVSQMSPCEAWSTTLSRLFGCIDRSIQEGDNILDKIPQDKLCRLTNNIVKVLEASMNSSDSSSDPPLATAKPWVLLYKITEHQEKYNETVDSSSKTCAPPTVPPPEDSPMPETLNTDSNMSSGDVIREVPASNLSPSLQFLRIAHEHLGRRGWCCNNEGVFLLLKVEVLTKELAKATVPAREEMVRDLEQCFLCLYGHPSKKAKARGLQEHNSSQIALTWSNSVGVFDYFKPPQPPTFDSKSNTISAEVQNLLRRITLVIPQQELEAISFESVQSFIEGGDEPIPKLPDRLVGVKRPVINEIFYLLADFYFKNKEFSKALKFYMHDVSVQPDRADTWAAMALARKRRLENKLNAVIPVLFDKDEMTSDNRASLLKRRDEMLLLSESCFTSALGIEDGEPWLHHYILGKITEKLNKPPSIYFRIHVSVLKLLFDKFPDVDVGVLEDHLQRASKGPFYHAEFDTDIGPGNVYRTESTTSESLSSSVFEDTKQSEPKSSEASGVANSVISPEPRQGEDFNPPQAEGNIAEEHKIATREVSAAEAPTVSTNKVEAGSQSEQSLDPTPMEVDLSNEPSRFTPAEETTDSSQTPLEVSSNEQRESLETKQAFQASEKNDSKYADQCAKGEEEMESSKDTELSLAGSDVIGDGKTVEELNAEEGVGETGMEVEHAGEQESVTCLENKLKDEEENVKSLDKLEESSADQETQEAVESTLNFEDTEIKTDKEITSNEDTEVNSKPEKMETEDIPTHGTENVEMTENTSAILSTSPDEPVTETPPAVSVTPTTDPAGVSASSVTPMENTKLPLTEEQQAKKRELMDLCIRALEYCLRRFSQHHKSRYRLAYVYYYSSEHKETSVCRDLLLGSNTRQCKTFPFPPQGLFNEKSKTNLFSAFWRIPEEDIDRPGCFCTHTYKSVALMLEVLRELNEWDTLLLIQALLYRTPEAGKKYLRDNERNYLARKVINIPVHSNGFKMSYAFVSYLWVEYSYLKFALQAFEYSLEIMKVRVSKQDPKVEVSLLSQLVMDAYECWKTGQRYEAHVKATEGLLTQAFEMFTASQSASGESLKLGQDTPTDSPTSLLDQALKYCQQLVKPQTSSANTSVSHQTKGSSGTDTGNDQTSGSDTDVVSTALEQTFSPPIPHQKENNTSVTSPVGDPIQASETVVPDLQADVAIERKTTDNTLTRSEDVPMIADLIPSSEAPITEGVQRDSDSVTLESENEKNRDTIEENSNSATADSISLREMNDASDDPRITSLPAQAGTPAAPVNPGGADITEVSDVPSST
ncbi:hypothetical protein pdam_00008112, partial [Pocillopora damicornis]